MTSDAVLEALRERAVRRANENNSEKDAERVAYKEPAEYLCRYLELPPRRSWQRGILHNSRRAWSDLAAARTAPASSLVVAESAVRPTSVVTAVDLQCLPPAIAHGASASIATSAQALSGAIVLPQKAGDGNLLPARRAWRSFTSVFASLPHARLRGRGSALPECSGVARLR